MDCITLENNTLRLEFARETGALVGFTVKDSAWEVLNRHHLGLSFQLLIPLPGRRNNPVYGEKQKVSSVDAAADGRSVAFTWDSVTSAYGGEHQIKLVMKVTLSSKQAVFRFRLTTSRNMSLRLCTAPILAMFNRRPALKHLRLSTMVMPKLCDAAYIPRLKIRWDIMVSIFRCNTVPILGEAARQPFPTYCFAVPTRGFMLA